MNAAYLLAWVAPLLFGSGLVAALCGRPRTPAAFAQTFACGFVLGVLACAVAIALLGRVPVARIVPMLAPAVAAIGISAWVWVWMRGRAAPAGPTAHDGRMHPLLWILLVLLLVRAVLMADEILLRPMYPWDAWAAWLLKPKAWMLGGTIDAFVPFDEWLADTSGTLRTAQTWNYPEMLGRIAIWFVSAFGQWNAAVVGALWMALWIALLAGAYGQLRALGLARDRTIIAVYALGSLPLINVHVALAGYADLWIAVVLAFACLSWLRWLESRAVGHLVLALLFALALPLIKLEGGIWLVILGATMIYGRMTPRWRRIALALAPLIGAGVVTAYLLRVPLIAPALDRVGMSSDVEVLVQHAPAVVSAAAHGLFAQYNWHLFWFAVALTLALRWTSLRDAPSLRVLGLFLLLGCGFLFTLFVLTPAGQWAESHTAVNRLSLQIVPAMLVFVALLWREPEPDAAPAPRMVEAAPTTP